MIRATLADVELVNACLGRDFPGVDFTEVLSEPLHVCLMEGESGAIFMWRGPGIYEAHVFYEVAGREALSLAEQMLDDMRANHGAEMFWSLVPVDNRKTKLFVRWLGWKSRGVLETRHGSNELFVSENVKCLQ